MRKAFIIILSVLILAPVQVSAQSSVEVSKDKIRIDGAIYYVHQVKQGQTIYDLSKAYGIPISEIEAHNPLSKDGLKPGSFIYIPADSVSSASASTKKSPEKQQEVNNQSGQSSGAKSVQEETAQQSGKNSEKTKSDGQKYRYRRGQTEETAAKTAKKEKTAKNTKAAKTAAAVETMEDVEDVAAVAGSAAATAAAVTTADVAVSVTESHQKYAQTQVPASNSVKTQEGLRESVTSDKISSGLYDRDNASHIVSLVLPFGKSASAGMSDVNHTDFYSGVLLALNDLRENPEYQKYRLDVIDLDRWDSVHQMCSGSSIGESDLIIGPISSDDMEQVSEFAKENRIPVISPLDIKTSSIADENPYVFIYPTSGETVQTRIIDRFTENSDGAVMIVICERGRETSSLAVNIFSTLENLGIPYTQYTYAILQNQKVGEDIKALVPEENTVPARILVASEDEAFVADALRNLNVLVTTDKRNIQVYGLPKWKNFGSVQLEYLHHLNTHISLNYYLDYELGATLEMTRKFEEIFHTSPTPYAYQGYDITKFFIEALENYGSSFPVEIYGMKNSALQSDICFIRKPDGKGFINTAVRDITYLPDWSVVLE